MLIEMTLSVLIGFYLLLWFYWLFVLGTPDGNLGVGVGFDLGDSGKFLGYCQESGKMPKFLE
jgi:hypothetical protein